jgi:hypothetical protein
VAWVHLTQDRDPGWRFINAVTKEGNLFLLAVTLLHCISSFTTM